MSYDYDSYLKFSVKSLNDNKTTPVFISHADGVQWYFQVKTKNYRAKLYFIMTCPPSCVGSSYSIEIKTHTPSSYSQEPTLITSSETKRSITFNRCQGIDVYHKPFQDLFNELRVVHLSVRVAIKSSKPLSPISKLFEDFAAPELADFTFVIEDEELQAHKFILKARSPVFRSMFAHDVYEETKTSIMKIVDASKPIFKLFLKFLYTAHIPRIPISAFMELLKLADKYQVDDLKKICDDSLVAMLKETHPVHEVYQFAHLYNCSPQLIHKAFSLTMSKHLNGKYLHESLIDKPEVIKKLVCLMGSFDNTLKEINEGVENQSAKRIKLS